MRPFRAWIFHWTIVFLMLPKCVIIYLIYFYYWAFKLIYNIIMTDFPFLMIE